MDIAIVGAGIVGAATAHALLDEGHSVTLYDANAPGFGPSRGNAGWLAHTDITPIAQPKALMQVPRWLMDPLGPLAIRPAYLLKIAPWLARFIAASRPAEVERSTVALAALQQLALPAWEKLAAQLALGPHIHKRGGLHVYRTDAAFKAGAQVAERQRSFGFGVEMISREVLRQLEPALSDRFVGAAHIENTAHVSDPLAITKALFDAALARGARYEQARITLINAATRPVLVGPNGWQRVTDAVVLAAGAWAKSLAAGVGDTVPLDTERGYNISFPGMTGLTRRPIAFEGEGFVATPLDSGLRIGGAVEFGGLEAPPNHARTRALHAKARQFLNGVPDYETGTEWMGFRPSMPDSLPVIGPSRRSPRVIHAFGHGHYGLTQSAVTAQLVADLLAGRQPPINLAPFSAQRF